jgi:hypothetical protein
MDKPSAFMEMDKLLPNQLLLNRMHLKSPNKPEWPLD